MKITPEITIDETTLDKLRRHWSCNPEKFNSVFEEFVETNNILREVKTTILSKLVERFKDDIAAANPDLEAAKREILSALYLYGENDKHNRFSLINTLRILDPGLAKKVSDEGVDTVWSERFSEE